VVRTRRGPGPDTLSSPDCPTTSRRRQAEVIQVPPPPIERRKACPESWVLTRFATCWKAVLS